MTTPAPTLLDRLTHRVDRLILAAAPRFGARRMADRARWQAVEKSLDQRLAYEGAEENDVRASRWMGSRLSEDASLAQDLDSLRHRSRELYRNDSLGGWVDTSVNHVVGCGFTLDARTPDDEFNTAAEQLVQDWAEACDPQRRWELWEQLRLAERHYIFDGESVTILSDVAALDGRIPLAIEVVDPLRLSTPDNQIMNPQISLGVERDDLGRVTHYHVQDQHPDDPGAAAPTWTRYPAARVIHSYERWFAGQSRGLPAFTRILNRAKDAKDLDESMIVAAQIETAFAAFVKSSGGAYEAAVGAGTGTRSDGTRYQEIESGRVHYLAEDEDVVFSNPTKPGNQFEPFQRWNYRRIASGMGQSYELMIKDWSGLSFAGGRLSLADARVAFRCRQKGCRSWLRRIYQVIILEAVALGELPLTSAAYQADPRPWLRSAWLPPAWSFELNPGETVEAAIKAIDHNLATAADFIAESGAGNLEDIHAQRAVERESEKVHGIQPREGAAGNPPADPPPPDPDDPSRNPPQPANADPEA